MNMKQIKKKIDAALKKVEELKSQNNYKILKPSEKAIDIPKKSLVVQLTDYDDKAPETS